ncbi:LOW QUALITY PROTEIN: hypothetical protein KUTeg_014285 [Tegillarca granosa]|uniref:YqaJ viral recombinase domain-containing protein n=1 Tax=Tegillarca granosa TaxID=220873 RepID=A0ABQ9EW55_TEGGR|nr:LOW QUALITY PROTEIN: hypothetical protein KUTeg_014285 [Tegillarca granosa]
MRKLPSLPPIKFLKEIRTNGLASDLSAECQGCRQTFRFETSPQLPMKNSNHYDINIRSVWGSMVTGSGVSNLNELMGTMNCPGMSQNTFSTIEEEIGEVRQDCVEEDLLAAGAEERTIAIRKGNFDQGVPCITVVADGGWSKRSHKHTYNALGGVRVQKLESFYILVLEINIVTYCLRSNLEKLVQENCKGKGRLTKAVRVKIVSAVRCSIRLRSQEDDRYKAIFKLEKDIRNSVHHVFGNHSNCVKPNDADNSSKDETISTKKQQEEDEENQSDNIPDVMDREYEIWKETKDIDKEEESRGNCNVNSILDTIMIRDISTLLDRVALKCTRLFGNFTTNLAESWMAIRSKFDGGKLYNRCNRGSWHARCYEGALRKNMGPQWATKVWEKTTSTAAGKFFKRTYEVRDQALTLSKQSQKRTGNRKRRWDRKMKGIQESTTKKAKKEYGSEALEAFGRMKEKKRLTASNFGLVIRRNPNIKVEKLVKQLVYPSFKGNKYTRKGLNDEIITIKEFTSRKEEENDPVTVQSVGLIIYEDKPFLAASPDGKVINKLGEIGLLEIKNLLHNKIETLNEAARRKDFCLQFINNRLHLKHQHQYYYQVQGQLNITKLPWLDFVVRTEKPYQLHIERIYRNEDLWFKTMLPKISAFYLKAILPELVAPSINTLSGIREPGNWSTTLPPHPPSINEDRAIDTKENMKSVDKSTEMSTQYSAVLMFKEEKAKTVKTSKNKRDRDSGSTSDPHIDAVDNIHPTSTITFKSTVSATDPKIRPQRQLKVKFVGRRIAHEWIEDEIKDVKKWYTGTVTGISSGRDGNPDAVYDVLYDGEDEVYSVDHLYEDYQSASLKFIDV